MGFSLFIREGHGSGETLRFDLPEVTFGRVTENDVVLNDPDVSRKHFSILQGDGCYFLKDLGSSNGTYLNGELVDTDVLSEGDEIQVGQIVFEFQLEKSSRNLPARRPRSSASPESPSTPARRTGSAPGAARGTDLAVGRRGAPRGGALAKTGGGSTRERFRVRKLASTPTGRLKLWHAGLEPKRRLLIHVTAGVTALVALIAAITLGGDEPVVGERDYSGRVVPYDGRIREWAFGYGVEGITHRARSDLGFSFSYGEGRVTLTFDVGFVDGENEVEIRLNDDRLVGYAPLSIGTWVRDIQVVLPLDGLVPNSMNTIVFDQVRNPGARPPATWAMRYLWIIENPLPTPDPRRAEERYALADTRWRNRAIGPGNLFEACRLYGEARDYLERLEVKPPLYDEAEARVRECTRELDAIYRRLIFQAQRYEQYRQWDQAKATLMQILEHFPDETDFRYRSIEWWLSDYN